MITIKHKYKGKWFAAGDSFQDGVHEKWACAAVRNYGKPTPKPKPSKKKTEDE